jgi:hypothetical protein
VGRNRLTITTASAPHWIIYRCARSLKHRSANTYQQNQGPIEQFVNSNVNCRRANILSNLQYKSQHSRRKHSSKAHKTSACWYEGQSDSWNEAVFFKYYRITHTRNKSLGSYIVLGKLLQPKQFENYCYFERTCQPIMQ